MIWGPHACVMSSPERRCQPYESQTATKLALVHLAACHDLHHSNKTQIDGIR